MFNRKNIIILIFLISNFIVIYKTHSQDIHFSQFFQSPVSLNPALTGAHAGEWRLADIYRNQWFTFKYPYRSHYFSFDKQLFFRASKFSIGFSLVEDKSGDDVFNLYKYYLNFACHPHFGNNNLHFGIQAGYVNRSYDFNKLTFPDQYDQLSGYYDPSFPTADIGLSQRINYYDINAGIAWDNTFGKTRTEAGIAFFHLNRPKETFSSSLNYLPTRKTAFFNIAFPLNNNINIVPQCMFSEINKASELLSGFYLLNKVNPEKSNIKSVNYGLLIRNGFKRNTDALILTGGLSYRRLNLGLSYDLNISSLRKYSSFQGAFEISIIYTAISKVFDQFMIPCERY